MRVVLSCIGFVCLLMIAGAQPFTYQGYLREGGLPANGTYQMTFRLFNAVSGGTALATVGPVNVSVSNGLFTQELNFGSVWTGEDRWLEIQVGSTVLVPRVKINPTPYASYSTATRGLNVDGNLNIGLLGVRKVIGLNPADAFGYDGKTMGHCAIGWFDDSWNGSGATAWLSGYAGIKLFTLGTPRLVINQTGNVGIGATNPNSPLTIQGTGASSEWIQLRNTAGANRWHINSLNGGFNVAESGVADGRLFLSAGGDVGIGTTNPQAKLHVNGDLRLLDDADVYGLDRLVGFNDLRLAGDDNPVGQADLVITSDGKVGHRKVYANGNFNITNAGYFFALNVERLDGLNLFQVLDDGRLYAGGLRNIGDHRNMQFNQSTGEIGWDTSSRRYKENIAPLEDDFPLVLQLEPKTYTRVGGDPNRWEIGYIAEEAHDLGLNRLVEYDQEGRPDGFNYEKMILYLKEVVKSQQSRIAELEKRLQRLEARPKR